MNKGSVNGDEAVQMYLQLPIRIYALTGKSYPPACTKVFSTLEILPHDGLSSFNNVKCIWLKGLYSLAPNNYFRMLSVWITKITSLNFVAYARHVFYLITSTSVMVVCTLYNMCIYPRQKSECKYFQELWVTVLYVGNTKRKRKLMYML